MSKISWPARRKLFTRSVPKDSGEISGVGPVGCTKELLPWVSLWKARIKRWSFHLAVSFGLLENCFVARELLEGVAVRRHSGILVEAGPRESDMWFSHDPQSSWRLNSLYKLDNYGAVCGVDAQPLARIILVIKLSHRVTEINLGGLSHAVTLRLTNWHIYFHQSNGTNGIKKGSRFAPDIRLLRREKKWVVKEGIHEAAASVKHPRPL